MKNDLVHRLLRKLFYQLGNAIGYHPYYFIIVPVVMSLILATGLFMVSEVTDIEYLYVPINSRALKEREAVEALFPSDDGSIDYLRMTRANASAVVIIEAKDGGSMLRESIMESVENVDDVIRNITIIWKGMSVKYEDLCSNYSREGCFKNTILEWKGKMKNFKKKGTCLKYPVNIEERSVFGTMYGIWLGGVVTDINECIEDVKAFRLLYFLRDATIEEREMAFMWEGAFLKTMSETNIDDVFIYRAVSTTVEREFARNFELIWPVIYVAVPLMLTFAVSTCFTTDCVTSKPWVGVAAFLSPSLAVLGSFGILGYCGAEYAILNLTLPFLLLGIGLDDSFVLLAAWRRTNREDKVEKRMSETYSEGAVSVTVTSLTNLLSFCVGLITPYRLLKSFFIYGSVSFLSAYIFEITFFGGILALSGYREEKNLNAFLFCPMKPKRTNGKWTISPRKVGSFNTDKKFSERKELVTFYRDKFGVILSKPLAKLFVIIAFILYLAGGIYNLRFLKEGLDFTNAYEFNSYAVNYTRKEYEYFSRYPHAIQIVINKTLDYSDPLIQNDVEEILQKFTKSYKMAGPELVDSWLRTYKLSTADSRLWISYQGYNFSRKEDFLEAMQVVFLKMLPFKRYNKDIILNENKTEITATRFIIINENISDNYQETDFIISLWKIADSFKYPVYVHNVRFVTQSLSVETKSFCILTLISATVLVIVIFFIIVPNILCTVLIGIVIASIQVSVIGYMSLWNVSMDIISSSCLVMCTGLSIDYSAHVSYSYIVCKQNNPNEKLRTALHAAGHPIFQGCCSTMLLVAIFPLGRAYSFTIFFKIMILLMVFAALHALFILPVFLTLYDTSVAMLCKNNNVDKGTSIKTEQDSVNLTKRRDVTEEYITSL